MRLWIYVYVFAFACGLVWAMSGCATAPEYFYCRGKGAWQFTAGAMIYSGNASLSSTCDDTGAMFYKGPKPPEVIPVPPGTPFAPVSK